MGRFPSFIIVVVISLESTSGLHENHGTIKMGVKIKTCDDGETNIDWDLPQPLEYYTECHGERIPVYKHLQYKESCLENSQLPDPIHQCMFTRLEYEDIPPRGGPHRPIWPVYGEYVYLPVGRWLHAMEHGAVVLLYDPCADAKEVDKLKAVVKGCLRKHVITPSEMLNRTRPMALLTWGCKLEFSRVNVTRAREFIKAKAKDPGRTNEHALAQDGDYKYGLVGRSTVVPGSDFDDSRLCPDEFADAPVGCALDDDDDDDDDGEGNGVGKKEKDNDEDKEEDEDYHPHLYRHILA